MRLFNILRFKLIVILLGFLFYQGQKASAQNYGDQWVFGEMAHVDFRQRLPVNGPQLSAISTSEGCASVSHPISGELLFYTDGISVWNRNHQLMPNGFGLFGHPSSSQSAIIVPMPGSLSRYYIFTVPEYNFLFPSNCHYSIVNMNLNGGLGDVENPKNNNVGGPVTERICVVDHANGQDYWIILKIFNSMDMHAYHLTAAGLNPTPIISTAFQIGRMVGYLKANLRGDKVVVANTPPANSNNFGGVEVYDFNNQTGVLTPKMMIGRIAYGLEFSPNGQFLYFTDDDYIYKYDVLNGTATTINSMFSIVANVTSGPRKGAFQLAPDQKIYITNNNSNYLSVINNPNASGDVNFQENGFTLATGATGRFGLPALMTSFKSLLSPSFICLGDTAFFEIINSRMIDSVIWDFGVAGIPAITTDSFRNFFIYPDTGNYKVSAIVYRGIFVDTITTNVYVDFFLDFSLSDTTMCASGFQFEPNLTNYRANFLWSNGNQSPTITIDSIGTYWVRAENKCMVKLDTFTVSSNLPPTGSELIDTSFCTVSFITIEYNDSNIHFLWSDGSTANNKFFQTSDTGFYWVQRFNDCGSSTDTIRIFPPKIPKIDLGGDKVLCENDTFTIVPAFDFGQIIWHNGSYQNNFTTTNAGLFWARVYNSCGTNVDSIYITREKPLEIDLGDDKEICEGDSAIIGVFLNTNNVKWNTGENQQFIRVFNSGQYIMSAENACGFFADSIQISAISGVGAIFPEDLYICYTENLSLEILTDNATGVRWIDGHEATFNRNFKKSGEYIVEVYNQCFSIFDTIIIDMQDFPKLNLGVDTVICLGDIIEFKLDSLPGYKISWMDGNKNATYSLTEPMEVGVSVETDRGCRSTAKVNVKDCGGRIYVPNAFSPNGDGFNEFFQVKGDGEFIFYELLIFDRWGQLVFKSNNIDDKWDGSNNGQAPAVGVYNYKLRFQNKNPGIARTKFGSLTILK